MSQQVAAAVDELRVRLEAAELDPLLDAIVALDAQARGAALEMVVERCRVWCSGDWRGTEDGDGGSSIQFAWHGTEEQRSAASLAALALGEPAELVARLRSKKPVQLRWGLAALPILQRFKPSWLELGGAEQLFEADLLDFSLMMELRELGWCPQPRSERYAVALIAAARRFYRDQTFLDVLDAHPRFRREDLRLIFSVEGTSEDNLAALDKYSKGTGGWAHVLLTLLQRGEFTRNELLDTTLEVLSRGYPSFRAGWYSRFHEQLEPTLEERAAHQADYERLLGSAVPQTASFALKALEILQQKRALRAESFLETIEPVLSAAQAETVKRALKMLSRLIKTQLSARERIAELGLVALAHQEAAVQSAAVALFRECSGFEQPELLERLRAATPALAPSVQSELGPIFGTEQAAKPASAAPAPLVWARPDPFAPERALRPPESLAAALDGMSRALEHPHDAEQFELALDAASRFGAADHAQLGRLGGPLRKRAQQLLERGPMEALQFELVRVALAWVTKQRHHHPHADLPSPGKIPQFAWRRSDALITRLLSGRGRALLSAPSHQHGHLAEAELSRRLQAHEGAIDFEDAVLALLRLPGPVALRLLPQLAQRVTEGQGALESSAGAFPSARARPRVLRWGEQYVWHRVQIDVEPTPEEPLPEGASLPERLLHALAQERGAYGFEPWLPLALPRAHEWVAAAEALEHGGYGFDEAARSGELRCWRDPSIEPGPNAYFALGVALGTRSASTSLSARDTLIAEIASGRLRPELLGQAFAALLPSGLIKVGRWQAHLTEVAAISPVYASAVWRSLLGALRGDASAYPRDFSKLLGLAKELKISLSAVCDDVEARRWLESVKGSSQLAKHAAALRG